ncbi:MAG: thiamine phosphate synthase [Methanomassiliicoccaceae archaeon]|nr:thiamine phosphate synthase [Methanomassiliicoccaceae archaeon]
MYGLYVITDEGLSGGLSHQEITRFACEGGADVIQLRDKTMDKERLTRVAMEMRRITSLHGTLFFVNDHVDVALASEADGVHLGQEDTDLVEAVRTGNGMLIGISVGSADEARAAEAGGASYIGFGPIFGTGSKHDAGPATGLDELRAIKEAVSIPVVAIGGITKENAASVTAAGADGVAVISAVVSQSDITKAARELRDTLRI